MVCYSRFMRKGLALLLLALAVTALAGCGGGSSSQSSSGTSALSFQVVWDRSGYQKESLTDCADVATVSAFVFGEGGDLLGEGGPWDCATGSGVIAGLPANYYATIQVAGYGPDGTTLYYGQSGSIFLNPGNVDGGVITAGPFVPELISPNNAAIVSPEALTLQWNRLTGAGAYLVTLANSDTFAAETIVAEYTVSDPDTTSLQVAAAGLQLELPYYWRVQALSPAGPPGTASAIRHFSLREVVITGITFVGDDPVVPSQVNTTVAFNYATITFSQEQDNAVIVQWSAQMDSTDYFALQQIITDSELMGQPDITYTPAACAGWSGLSVSMIYNAATYGFTISPQVCNRTEWPTGVNNLVTLKDELVSKYYE